LTSCDCRLLRTSKHRASLAVLRPFTSGFDSARHRDSADCVRSSLRSIATSGFTVESLAEKLDQCMIVLLPRMKARPEPSEPLWQHPHKRPRTDEQNTRQAYLDVYFRYNRQLFEPNSALANIMADTETPAWRRLQQAYALMEGTHA